MANEYNELRAKAKALGLTVPKGTKLPELRALVADAEGQSEPAGEAETPDVRPAAPEPTKPERKPTGTRRIVRETDAAWWCPVCDHSMTQALTKCARCGATRNGDHVTP